MQDSPSSILETYYKGNAERVPLPRLIIAAHFISFYPPSRRIYLAFGCNVLDYIINDPSKLIERYPGGVNWEDTTHVAVKADFNGITNDRREEFAAVAQAGFALAAWSSLALHVIGIEVCT